jgi:hypothetical protein
MRVPLLIVVVCGLAAAAACGGSDEGTTSETTAVTTSAATAVTESGTTEATSAGAGGETVPASQWVADVCGAVSNWQSELTTGAPDVSDVSDVDAAKETLSDYLDKTVTATNSMIEDVKTAGVPDIEQGEAVASEFQTMLTSVGQSLQDAKTDLDALPADDPAALADGLQEIAATLQSAGTEAAQALDQLSGPTLGLDEAASNEPACQSVG